MEILSKLLELNQHGILLTQRNGHFYFDYETDLEMSPTEESEALLKAMSDKGIDLRYKQYGSLEEVLNRFDWLLGTLGLKYSNETDAEVQANVIRGCCFDYEKIMRPNTVIHCKTKEQAKELLKWADSKGLKWCDGNSYLEENNWEKHREDTCYNLCVGAYSDKRDYKDCDYIILPYEEVLCWKTW